MNDDINLLKKIRKDGWSNLFTGLGTKADKRRHTFNRSTGVISDRELEAIYCEDGLGAKIIDLLPEDMMKQGWNYVFNNMKEGMENVSLQYEKIMQSIDIYSKLSQALKWARLYGGAILIIGAYDGQNLDQPLIPIRIRQFEGFKVVARTNIQFEDMKFQDDASKPRFGKVEYYPVNFRIGNENKIVNVHYSRVIEFHGIDVPNIQGSALASKYRYWGLPILQRVKERLGDIGLIFGSISNLMQESSIGKFKFKDLADILAQEEGSKMMQNRLQTMDLMKSVFHSLLMDSEDEYIRDTISFGGMSDVIHQFFMLISASTGYPMTRLFGVSPGGLNSSGDSDTYAYYDMVRSKQQLELLPVLNRIITIIAEWRNLEVPEIQFNALEQMTEKEQAELEEKRANTEKTKAETYQAYIDMGIMEPYMVEELEFGETLKKLASNNSDLPPVEGMEE